MRILTLDKDMNIISDFYRNTLLFFRLRRNPETAMEIVQIYHDHGDLITLDNVSFDNLMVWHSDMQDLNLMSFLEVVRCALFDLAPYTENAEVLSLVGDWDEFYSDLTSRISHE